MWAYNSGDFLMAIPNRNSLMKRNLAIQKNKDSRPNGCNKQFPECPEELNKNDCGCCPFWK